MAALTKDLSSVPSTHGEWLITAYNSWARGIPYPLTFVGTALMSYTPTHTGADTHAHNLKVNKTLKNMSEE